MLISIVGADTLRPGLWHRDFKVGLGLDLSGGTSVVLQAQAPKGSPPSAAAMDQAQSILTQRVNGTGATGALVQRQGSDLINVQVPGKDATQVINLVSTTAQMSFRQALLFQRHGTSAPYGDAHQVSPAALRQFRSLACTPGSPDSWKPTVGYSPQQAQWNDGGRQIVSCDLAGDKYVLATAVFKGTDVTSENLVQSPGAGWGVNVTLDGAATTAFGALTTTQHAEYYPSASVNGDDAVLDQTALVLDGDVVSAPQTHDVLAAGQFQITGSFTRQQAQQLTDELKYGALPLSFHRLDLNSVSAQLGADSLKAGLIAGGVGLDLVGAYSFVYYRGLGAVSVSSLLLAGLLTFMAVVLLSRFQGFTLDLPGIAGLAVAIGITADSFVVFFERIRDGMRDGRTLRAAVEHGWKRARRTILVSDTVSFLAAAVLYWFAIGGVRGFAYTLGLTTLIDVLVVFGFTKPVLTLLARTRFYGGGHPWSGLDPARLGVRRRRTGL
jgi:preprotein translocase subunit SecD